MPESTAQSVQGSSALCTTGPGEPHPRHMPFAFNFDHRPAHWTSPHILNTPKLVRSGRRVSRRGQSQRKRATGLCGIQDAIIP